MFKLGSAVVMTVAAGAMVFAGAGAASADTGAEGLAYGSPGVLSGNVVQIPVHVPVNACGNSLNIIGLLNPSLGNACADGHFDRANEDAKAKHHSGAKVEHHGK
ncbi:chaplin [Streptomyces glycanivorans]|uniref:Chaplin n=1 Tax=Streptomyces glycanivorans TaxID=3033808 RepID=A0ABY9JLL3_9ACTN|nr:chaplin [Streptomyces sp. Alt3]WLQ68615.1 chaplin [Streptomyces sp. Alt3]